MQQYSLTELLRDYEMYHSQYQQDNFIMGGGGNLWGQYKQSLREVFSRVENLKNLSFEREKLVIEIEEQDYLSEVVDDNNPYKQRYAEIECRRKKANLISLDINIKACKKELLRFFTGATYMREKLESQYGELTSEVKKQLEEDLWFFKAKEQILTSLITEGRINSGVFEFIHSLPKSTKENLFKDIQLAEGPDAGKVNIDKLTSWYFEAKVPEVPNNLPTIGFDELETQLIGIKEKALLEV